MSQAGPSDTNLGIRSLRGNGYYAGEIVEATHSNGKICPVADEGSLE